MSAECVLSVVYVPFFTDHGAFDHALRHTKLSDGTYYIDAIGGAEYQALCVTFPDRDGRIHDRTGAVAE